MAATTIGATTVHVDAEGFLTEYDEWNEPLAVQLAAQIGIELTDAHWQIIRFPAHGLCRAGRDRDVAPSVHSGQCRGQRPVHPLPRQAGQEDGLHRRATQAAWLRVRRAR
jgi:hypothetical protein